MRTSDFDFGLDYTSRIHKQLVQFGFSEFDWWFWVLILTLPTLKALGFWWLMRSFAKKKSAAIQLDTQLVRLTGLPKSADPVQLFLSIDAVVPKTSETNLGRRIPVFRSAGPAHEAKEADPTEARFETEDCDFVFAWDADDDEDRVWEISLVYHSGQSAFAGSTRILRKKEFVSLDEKRRLDEIVQLKNANGEKVLVEFNFGVTRIESNLQRILAARSALAASMRRQQFLVVFAHLVALTTAVAFAYLGIRYIFSGCFIVSIASLVAASLIALSTVAVLIVWGAMKGPTDDKMARINQLNTKFRAALCACAGVVIWLLSELTGENSVGQQWFDFWAMISLVDAFCFAYAYWKFDANENTDQLFTADFLVEEAAIQV